jgi:uncharacterized protein YggE
MRTRNTLIIAAVSVCIAAVTVISLTNSKVHAQASGNVNYNYQQTQPSSVNLSVNVPHESSIVLDAEVMMNVKASSYVAIFSATQGGKTVASADSMMNARLKKFMRSLEKNGIKGSDVHIDFISLVPGFEVEAKKFSNTANEVPAGFQMKKNIHVIIKEHEQLDLVITSAAESEIYDLVKVDYNVKDIRKIYDSLRVAASRIIDQKKKIYDQMGLSAEVVNLSEGYNCAYPTERYSQFTAFHSGTSRYAVVAQNPNVEIKSADKASSVYYNRIAYNQFDEVINADAVEPMVQFYYTLKVRYNIQPRPVKPTTGKVSASK